jgi:hypothetical protein
MQLLTPFFKLKPDQVTPLTVGMVNHELDNLVQANNQESRAKVFVQLFDHISKDNVRALSSSLSDITCLLDLHDAPILRAGQELKASWLRLTTRPLRR